MKHLLATTLALTLSSLATAQLSCSVTSCGSSCGPTLTVTFTPVGNAGNKTISITGNGLHAHSLCALAWADNLLPSPLPMPGGCPLLIDAVWSTLHTTNSSGSFNFFRTWPHWATADYRMQMGSIQVNANNSFSILTTECQMASCW